MNYTARFNGLLHKRHQTLGGGIRDAAHTNASNPISILLSGNYNQRLGFGLAAANAPLFAAPIRLIHFHLAGEAIPFPGRTMARRNLCSQVQAVL
jgi:hypothetical protein